jgi:hypothetical protein
MRVIPETMRSTESKLTKRLHELSGLSWTLAPLSWDEQGRASQDLFVLRPVSNGVERVRQEKLRTRLKKARKMKRNWLGQGNATMGTNATNATGGVAPFGGEEPIDGEQDYFPEEGGGDDHQ